MKISVRCIGYSIFLLLIISSYSCQRQSTKWRGTIEEVDGVIVVKNPKEPMYREDVFSLEEELSIGEAEGREEYMFTRIMIDVDDDENIYVLDGKAANIRVFDNQGDYIRTIGKRGQGPGEFEGPRYIQITPQNEVMAYDFGNRRISFFTLKGSFLRQVSAATQLIILYLQKDNEGNYVGYVLNRDGAIELKKFDSELQPTSTLFSKQLARNKTIHLITLQLLFSLTRDGKLAWAFPETYEIQVVGHGSEGRYKIIKDYDQIKITSKDKKRMMNETLGSRGVPEGYTIFCPEHYPPFRGLFLDEEGRIFLETYEKSEEGGRYSDVFDPDGRYIAKVQLGINPIWLVWKNKKLYTIETDDLGYMFVKRYKVNWNIDSSE